MSKTFQFGNGEWAVGKETALAYNDENSNFKPLAFTFDRASTATVVNKQGLIETVGVDEPRIDFLNNTKGHLLLEPQRTNYVFPSNSFSSWSVSGGSVSITPNYGISPDGTQNSSRTDFSNGAVIYTIPNRPQGAYVFSVFAKNIEGGGSVIQLRVDVPASFTTRFDLSNGTIVSSDNDDAKIEYYGNGWYRCIIIQNNDGIVNAVIGEGTTELDCELFGGMLEEGSYATSYIPTQGSTVTRSVDYTKIVNSPILQGTNQFTLFFEAKDFLLVNGTNVTFDNIMLVFGAGESAYDSGTGIHIYNRTWYYYNGSSAVNIGVCYNGLTDSKFAISYDGTKFTRYAGGIKLGEFVTSASMVNWDTITTGAMGDTQNDERNFNLSDLRLYDTALTDAELIALTS